MDNTLLYFEMEDNFSASRWLLALAWVSSGNYFFDGRGASTNWWEGWKKKYI